MRANILPRALGSVLLAAASLKAAEFATTTEQTAVLVGLLVICLIALEIALGLWLLSGIAPNRARLVAILCFAAFLGAASAQALSGQTSCACMGRLRVSPWLTALFDLGAVVLLCRCHPTPCSAVRTGQRAWRSALVALSILAGGVVGLENVRAFWATDASPGVSANTVDFESVPQGGLAEREMWVDNALASQVEVSSVWTSCPCLAVRLSKQVMSPGERIAARVILDLSSEPDFVGDLRIQAKGLTKNGVVVFVARVHVRVEPRAARGR